MLEEVVKFLYRGGDPSNRCTALLHQMGISANGLDKNWKGKWRSCTIKDDDSPIER